jgi:hypothetical protein
MDWGVPNTKPLPCLLLLFIVSIVVLVVLAGWLSERFKCVGYRKKLSSSLFAQLISLPQCGSVRLSGLVGNSKLVKGEKFLAVFF